MDDKKLAMAYRIISAHLDIDENTIAPDKSLLNDLGAEYDDIFELIMAFEENFDIVVDDDEIETIYYVKDLLKLIVD